MMQSVTVKACIMTVTQLANLGLGCFSYAVDIRMTSRVPCLCIRPKYIVPSIDHRGETLRPLMRLRPLALLQLKLAQ